MASFPVTIRNMKIVIVSVGKPSAPALKALISEYEPRLKRMRVTLEWQIIQPDRQSSHEASKHTEGKKIIAGLPPRAYCVLLDETGQELNSKGWAEALQKSQQQFNQIVFIIGGAYGVSEEVISHADAVWSLSPLTLPHQLVRLIVVEQVYRAFSIIANSPYHHE